MTPTGSWPMTSPGRTGYSPLRMCTSVPQIVVSVTRMTPRRTRLAAAGPPRRGCRRDRGTRPRASSRSPALLVGGLSVSVHCGPLSFGSTLGGTGRARCGQPAAQPVVIVCGDGVAAKGQRSPRTGTLAGTGRRVDRRVVGLVDKGRTALVGRDAPSILLVRHRKEADRWHRPVRRAGRSSRRPSSTITRSCIAALDSIHKAAEELADLPADRKSNSIAKVLSWVDETLKPHWPWKSRGSARTRYAGPDHVGHSAGSVRSPTDRRSGEPGQSTSIGTRRVVTHAKRRRSCSGASLGLETLLRADLEREAALPDPVRLAQRGGTDGHRNGAIDASTAG